jgi:hypothetical protein
MREVLEDKLRVIAENSLTIEALRYIFGEVIEKEKPDIETTDDNTALGERYRAYLQAKILVEKVFLKIDSYNTKKNDLEEINRGK